MPSTAKGRQAHHVTPFTVRPRAPLRAARPTLTTPFTVRPYLIRTYISNQGGTPRTTSSP